MKNLFRFLMAVAVLFTVSCAKEDVSSSLAGGEVEVTFTANLADLGTRAYGDGTTANKVYLGIYSKQGALLEGLTKPEGYDILNGSKKVNISVVLLKDKEYQLVFWAQNSEAGCYSMNWETRQLTVNYDGAVSQDETRDAFFHVDNSFVAGADKNPTFTLKRPFAQLRAAISEADKNYITLNEVSIVKSMAVVTNVANVLDLSTEEATVSGEETVTFNGVPVPAGENETIVVAGQTYYQLSMNYLLVDEKRLVDVDYTFGDGSTDYKRPYYQVPVQRNYRTNIVGQLISSPYEFEVIIDSDFEKDEQGNLLPDNTIVIAGDVTLTEDLLSTKVIVEKSAVLNLNGYTLEGVIEVNEGAKAVVSNGKIVNTNNTINAISSYGDLTLNNVEVESARHAVRIEAGSAVINGGTYKVVPTSKSTLYALNVGNSGVAVNVTINGGTFIGPKGTMADSGGALTVKANATVNIKGGNFSGGKLNTISNSGTLVISGGVFDQNPKAQWVATGYEAIEKYDGFHVVAQLVADLFNVTTETSVEFTENLNVTTGATIHTQGATANITIDGNGKSVVSTAESANDFQWENGKFPAMSTIFSSEKGSNATVTVSNLTFEGTMSAVMLGHYVDSNSNWYNTELNNVNIVNTKVVSFSSNVAPAVCVYGKATLKDCNVYGTTRSELETSPMWPVYDIAAVNESVLTLNNSNVGSIIAWAKSKIVVEAGSVVESITPQYTSMNTNAKYGVVVKAGATVNVLDLSNIALPAKKINITVEEGATVGKVIDANGVEYTSLDEYKSSMFVSTAEDFATALKSDAKSIAIILSEDIDCPITSLGQQTGGSGEYKLGGESTKSIFIDLNGHNLNISTTYWSVLGAKNNDAVFTIKNGTMTSSQASGTWNSYDLCFANCNYNFENVVFEKAIALEAANKVYNLKNVTINETHDYYAIWVSAKGQNITIDGLNVNSAGRAVKIDEQYVSDSAKAQVTMNVSNATFKSAKKSAIIVKSTEGAVINWGAGNDITNVAADSVNAVWVDANAAAYADKVIVNGASCIVEE